MLEEAIGVVGVLPPIERAGEEVDIIVDEVSCDEEKSKLATHRYQMSLSSLCVKDD